MKELLRSTTAYRSFLAGAESGELPGASLVLFPDGKYLRELLRECAAAFFGAKDGSRAAELIGGERYPDCLFFPAAGEKLTADDLKRVVEESMLRPVEAERKLFVFDAFHTAMPLLQNKLLKLLEEPPEGVYFLLGATSEFSVLPTVLSRVRRYRIPPFSEEEIARALSRKYPGEKVSECAAASGGIFSVGESLLSDGGEEFRLAAAFLSFRETEAFCREEGERKNGREFFAALRSVLRDLMFLSVGQERFVRLGRERLKGLAGEYSAGAAIAALGLVDEAEKQLQFNANYASCLLTLAMGIQEEKKKWQKLS